MTFSGLIPGFGIVVILYISFQNGFATATRGRFGRGRQYQEEYFKEKSTRKRIEKDETRLVGHRNQTKPRTQISHTVIRKTKGTTKNRNANRNQKYKQQ